MFLETDRLILRKIQERDFDDYCSYSLNKPELDRMMGRDTLKTIQDVRNNFNWLKDKEDRAYVLVHKETNHVIGNLTIYQKAPYQDLLGQCTRSLSFCISQKYQRKGLMFEALTAVIHHLFTNETADCIHCGCFDFNIPSLSLQQKLGFEPFASEQIVWNGEVITTRENILRKETYLQDHTQEENIL